MKRTLPVLLGVCLAWACGAGKSAKPCADASCLQVAGVYRSDVTWTQPSADAGPLCNQALQQLQSQDPAHRVTLVVGQKGSALTVRADEGPLSASGQGLLFEDGSTTLSADGSVGAGADGGVGLQATDHLDILATFTPTDGGMLLKGSAIGRVHVSVGSAGASEAVDCALDSQLSGARQ